MKIIISPAKRMTNENNYLELNQYPIYLKETQQLLSSIKSMTLSQLQFVLECNDAIAMQAYEQFQQMNLTHKGTAALLSYQGIQYSSMAPHVFTDEEYTYLQEHLRILSGFYGILRPLDQVQPYRLELNNRFQFDEWKSLYAFWGDKPYQALQETEVIVDLASVQYSKLIKKYVPIKTRFVKCYFMEQTQQGYKEKGVYVKIARGEMVRYLAENKITKLDDIKSFNRCGYQFQESLSNQENYIFTR